MLLLLAGVAAAEGSALLAAAIQQHVAEELGARAEDVEVVHLGVAGFSCGEAPRIIIESRPGERFVGPTELKITAMDGAELCGRWRASVQLALWRELPVAAQAVAPGEVVPVVLQRVRLQRELGTVIDPSAGPYLARAALRSGEPLTTVKTRARPDATAGQAVVLQLSSGPLQIRCDGQLLVDAHIGDRVRARCETTHATIEGTLVAVDRVQAL